MQNENLTSHLRRADIDGLRAIAVLAVILFHFHIGPFKAGFLGVDVFFVISGFLITGIIHSELAAGNFSIVRFYERRARRLMPSLLAVLALILAGGFWLFTQPYFKEFSAAFLSSLLFVSNIHFWQHVDYFDTTADTQPLLHLWSLAVEAQFYLLWPIVLGLLIRRPRFLTLAVMALLLLLSLVGAELFARHDPMGAFYLLPFRAFELIVGAMAFWCCSMPLKNRILAELLVVGSLVLMVAAFVGVFGTNKTPSFYSLIPCVATACLLYAGSNTLSARLLTAPLIVYVGLISYQLYLVHWPLYAFVRYQQVGPMSVTLLGAMIAITFVAAAAIYHWVDLPHRRTRGRARPFFIAIAAISAVFALLALGMRYDVRKNAAPQQNPSTTPTTPIPYGGLYWTTGNVTTIGAANTPPSLILFGDSYAAQYAGGLDALLKSEQRSALVLLQNGCFISPNLFARPYADGTEMCEGQFAKVKELARAHPLPMIVSYNWYGYADNLYDRNNQSLRFSSNAQYYDTIIKEVAALRANFAPETPMLFIGLHPSLGDYKSLLRCMDATPPEGLECRAEMAVDEAGLWPVEEFNARLSQYAQSAPHVLFIDPRKALCPGAKCSVIKHGRAMYFDEVHLSLDGSIYLVEQFKDIILPLARAQSVAAP